MNPIQVVDSHTAGEPTRLVLAGFPELGRGTMAERRVLLASEHDLWRCATILEPRGSDILVGALLCELVDPHNAAGVIFFNNTGYLGMCGHGTIGLVASLAHLGRLRPGVHGIETPVGTVRATLHTDGSVSVRNVPAHRTLKNVRLTLPDGHTVVGDVAWSGNWFFLAKAHDQLIAPENAAALTAFAMAVRQALLHHGICGDNGGLIDHIELFAEDSNADSRNFVLCPGDAYDRSPCGTGTSAKIACLAADGALAPGQVWRQAGILGSCFEASYEIEDGQIVPTIRGSAFVTAQATLLLDGRDPYRWGIASGRRP